jgi:hypothetical protein
MPGLTSRGRARGVRKYNIDLTHSLRKCFRYEEGSYLIWLIVREIPALLGYSEYLDNN